MVYLPRGELIGFLHVIHNLLQRLFIFDIHLIADFPFSIPIVDHDGRTEVAEALRASGLEVASSKIVSSDLKDSGNLWSGRGCVRRLLSLLYTVVRLSVVLSGTP